MGQAAFKMQRLRERSERDQKRGRNPLKTSAEEKGALQRMRKEAAAKGAKLHNGGVGGLPSSTVLHVFRRDDFTCKKCGTRDNPIGVHHKGGIPDSAWLKKKGHRNDLNNMVTICDECHDDVHEEAREEGKE